MFRIGEFSKFSRVSVRMLRHYDQLGLLRPAHVDPTTEYRYYTADQLPRLHRIIALQDIGFSLEQIRGLLERPVSAEEMRGMLMLKQAELQTKLEDDLERLNRIGERIRQVEESDHAQYDVVVRSVEPLRVALIMAREAENLTLLFEELEFYVSRHKARQEQPPLALYFGDEAGNGDSELAVAVPLKAELAENERVQVMELPGELMACVVHHGGYETMHLAGSALMRWIEANPYAAAGPATRPMREVYYRFGADQQGYRLPAGYLATKDEEFVTELQIPIERK